MAKYKYLVVQTKSKRPFQSGDVVAQKEVTGLDKMGIGREWGKLEVKYPDTDYMTFLSEGTNVRREFQNEPIKQ
ncbi:hypothetical protein [Flavobacterium sp. T12S277]|uniref:hypothetical protein n=1 Tax=Flavobacterium sp. T12S277 TaxID=3402752 RepID=UPI003AE56E0D